jgi:hypothetical protein
MLRLGAVLALFVVGTAAAETEPYAGVFGMVGTGGMGCDENPMRLTRQGAAGPFVMAWARPVATGDGSEASALTFREGRMQGRWLYLTNVGQDDVALLQFSEDFGRFVLMAKVVKRWTGGDDPRAEFRRCPAVGS